MKPIFVVVSCLFVTLSMSCSSDIHSNKLSLYGTYEGNLPCFNCKGVHTSLTLYQDSFYLEQYFEGRKDRHRTEISGTYRWLMHKKNIIKLEAKEAPRFYRVENNQLRQLDTRGRFIGGTASEQYVLTKKNET